VRPPELSAIILAGGEGARLRALTRALTGDDRPKQFCAVMGEHTLLEQTRRRVAMLVPPDRTLTVVTRRHERYYAEALDDVPARLIVAQPDNRGTAPAIVYALLRLVAIAPESLVALFPSDHFVSDDAGFMATVEQAFATALVRPASVALLGITPDRAEVEYGWVEPGEVVAGAPVPAYRVRRFREKPPRELAERLLQRGCFWNSFVVAGRAASLLALVERSAPSLLAAFAPLREHVLTPREAAVACDVYAALPAVDFSKAVLTSSAERLTVVPMTGVEWSDLGDPARVAAARERGASLLATT
jgi:mannose-1-phosphate guanylyltransferase